MFCMPMPTLWIAFVSELHNINKLALPYKYCKLQLQCHPLTSTWCDWSLITQPIVFFELYNLQLTACMFKQLTWLLRLSISNGKGQLNFTWYLKQYNISRVHISIHAQQFTKMHGNTVFKNVILEELNCFDNKTLCTVGCKKNGKV